MQSISTSTEARPALALLLGTTVLAFGWSPVAGQEAAVGTEAEEEALVTAEAAEQGDGGFVLDTLIVTAAPGTTTEDTGSWTTEWMRSATGLPLSQKETPQSTSVITDGQMKDRNITSVPEVMEAATGVTVLPFDSERLNYYSRGFEIDAYQYDGVPVPRDGTWQFGDNNADMILYDHVEIVRGATGLMQGAGEPGASINFIRKRPTSFLRRETAAAIAYPTGGRAEADISGPLNDSGSVRGRLLGAVDSREGTLDGYGKDRYVGFGTVEVDLSDTTLLNVGISYQDTSANNVTWGGLPPWYSDFSLIDWDWGSSLGADWTYVDTQRTEAYASLEHVFENGWTGRLVATHVRNDMQSQLNWVSPNTDAAGNPTYPDRETGLGMGPWAAKYDGGYVQNSLNAIANGDFQALGRTHQFVLGAMASKGDGTYHGYAVDNATLAPVGDIFDWSQDYPEPDFSNAATETYKTEVTQIGLYGTMQFHATDALALLGGARVNWWDGSETGPYSAYDYSYKGIVTPYLGFTYDIDETYTAYGSITSIYQPQLCRTSTATISIRLTAGTTNSASRRASSTARSMPRPRSSRPTRRTWRNMSATSTPSSAASTSASTASPPAASSSRRPAPSAIAGTFPSATPTPRPRTTTATRSTPTRRGTRSRPRPTIASPASSTTG